MPEDDASLLAANAAFAAGDLDGAAAHCAAVLDHTPDHSAALAGLAMTLQRRGRFADALPLLDRALRQPGAPWQVHNARAATLAALDRPAEALDAFGQALALAPDEPSLHLNRGIAQLTLQQDEAALASFTRAVTLAPGLQPAWHNRAILELRLWRFDDALASCDRLVAWHPDRAGPHLMRGKALLELLRHADALTALDMAATLGPLPADAQVNRAAALSAVGRGAEAIAAIDAVLQLDPAYVPAHWTAASICLSHGDFARGWREYEWRWRDSTHRDPPRDFGRPLWRGDQPLAGRTILLHAEQGFGDTIQFCRYAPLVRARGARVIVEAPAPLLPLLRTLDGPADLVAAGEPLPPFDVHCPLMSLPLAFGTSAETVPARIPYLAASPDRTAVWAKRLGPRTRPRIGLAWSGLAKYKADRARSAPLRALATLIHPGFDYISVQRDVAPGDLPAAAAFGIRLFGEHIADFADSAALTAAMDLVISVDSSPAHLAGALGRPVWIMVPYHAEWRWLRDRSDTPWYSTATLFRQHAPFAWEALATRIGNALVP